MYLDPSRHQGDMQNHERMYFFSRDIIRVKNPLAEDFRFKYDSIWTTVRAGQTKDMERYLAVKYCMDIAQAIIGQMIVAQGEQAVKNYKDANPQILLDKYVENRTIWDKVPRLDDIELNTKIWKDIWLGVVEKYGEDRDVAQPQTGKLTVGTSLQEQLVERFKNVFAKDEPVESVPVNQTQAPIPTPPDPEPVSQVVSDRSLESEVTASE